MKNTKTIFAIGSTLTSILFFLTTASLSARADIFELNFYQFDDANAAQLNSFLGEFDEQIATGFGGAISPRLKVADPVLQNSALPETVSPFDFGLITVHRFNDRQSFDDFQPNYEALATQFAVDDIVTSRTRILSESNALAADAPLLGDRTPMGGESFYLVNAPQITPEPALQSQFFNEFVEAAVPATLETGTVIYQSFAPTEVLEGEFNFALLAISEWPSQAAFDLIHEDPSFLRDVFPLRNPALTNFHEARAVAQVVPEPTAMRLLLCGVGLVGLRRRRRCAS